MVATAKKVGFEPLGEFILVRPLKQQETPGGLALPEGAEPEMPRGIVVAVGPGKVTEYGQRIEQEVEPGDMVCLHFAYSNPVEIKLDGRVHLVTRARDLVGRIPRTN